MREGSERWSILGHAVPDVKPTASVRDYDISNKNSNLHFMIECHAVDGETVEAYALRLVIGRP